jgi:uncharacterized cupredoxin-like copper-binding protein
MRNSKGEIETMRRLFTCGALMGMTALTACGGSSNNVQPAAASTEAATTVDATVSDFKVELSQASAVAGKIAFAVTGGGPSTHEMVAFKTDLPEDQLPVVSSTKKVDEAAATVKHFAPEAENVAKGGSKKVVLDLPVGKYVFICNVPGHYSLGMHAAFEVLPPATAANNVNATVADFQITLDKTSASAGVVAVHVSGKGPSQHELVAFKTDLAPDALPVDPATSKMDEANPAVEHFSPEAEKIDAGGLKSINLNLPAGKYVFICNVPGHYKLGMHAAFTVN